MTAIKWLILDNLAHGWAPATNICGHKEEFTATYARCVETGLIADGRITDAGRMALMTDRVIAKAKP
jgi:hypothetical protein